MEHRLELPVFRPTPEEFSNFAKYIETIEPKCENVGLCKVIPPKGWFKRTYNDLDLTIHAPIRQCVGGKAGYFSVNMVEGKKMKLQEYETFASKRSIGKEVTELLDKQDVTVKELLPILERKFWKSLNPEMPPPVYGADLPGSLFGETTDLAWNLNRLDTVLQLLAVDLPGITTSMLYCGMWKSMFAIHKEDLDLYSINYLHTGRPKVWYAVPPANAHQVESLGQAFFPEEASRCKEFLRHKTCMFSPTRLKENGIPFTSTIHFPGEFMITFPRSYHFGFNVGFNIAEAVNFATERWIPIGKEAKICKCQPYTVRIDINTLEKKLGAHTDSETYFVRRQNGEGNEKPLEFDGGVIVGDVRQSESYSESMKTHVHGRDLCTNKCIAENVCEARQGNGNPDSHFSKSTKCGTAKRAPAKVGTLGPMQAPPKLKQEKMNAEDDNSAATTAAANNENGKAFSPYKLQGIGVRQLDQHDSQGQQQETSSCGQLHTLEQTGEIDSRTLSVSDEEQDKEGAKTFPWRFRCACGIVCSSEDPQISSLTERSFECSDCRSWCHLQCNFPELMKMKDEELPRKLYCQSCLKAKPHRKRTIKNALLRWKQKKSDKKNSNKVNAESENGQSTQAKENKSTIRTELKKDKQSQRRGPTQTESRKRRRTDSEGWKFDCSCGVRCSSDSPKDEALKGRCFECSSCASWAHFACEWPKYQEIISKNLPRRLLCHNCKEAKSLAAEKIANTAAATKKKSKQLDKSKVNEKVSKTARQKKLKDRSLDHEGKHGAQKRQEKKEKRKEIEKGRKEKEKERKDGEGKRAKSKKTKNGARPAASNRNAEEDDGKPNKRKLKRIHETIEVQEAPLDTKETWTADEWEFHCSCGVHCTSRRPVKAAWEKRSFECSACSRWAHFGCEQPALENVKDEGLPQLLLCERCRKSTGLNYNHRQIRHSTRGDEYFRVV